jgi:hypothetical protein
MNSAGHVRERNTTQRTISTGTIGVAGRLANKEGIAEDSILRTIEVLSRGEEVRFTHHSRRKIPIIKKPNNLGVA